MATAAVTRLGGAIGLILRENYVSVVACQEMNEALERQDSAALFSASGRSEIAARLLTEQRTAFDRAFAREAGNVTLPGEGARVQELSALYGDYVHEVDRVLAEPVPARIAGYFQDLLPRVDAVRAKVTVIRLMNQRNMEAADQRARRLARHTLEFALLMTALTLAVTAWLALRVPRTVLEPILAFTRHARAIGEGRLDSAIPVPDTAELNELGDALNRMQERLRAYRESSLGELLAAKDLARATIASMVDPVLVFGSRAEIVLANDAAESIFGVVSGDLDLLRRGGIEIPEPIALARDAVLTHGQPLFPQSLSDAMRWITGEGEKYFLVRALPLPSEDSAGTSVIVVAQDVTRFRRIDALKSDVVATVSHELKTPLTSLRLATHMLLEDSTGPLGSIQRELAITARNETERLQTTVNELLDLVRIERDAGALQRAPVNPSSLLREVASAQRSAAELKPVSIEVDDDDTPDVIVEVDAEQVVIVLNNLVSNAIRHSHESGHVWLRSYAEGPTQVFEVRDDGEGIARDQLPHIFERHWSGSQPSTLKERHGLGLAIAQEIAVRHGGSIDVETELGKGSTFRLRVPSAPSGASRRGVA